LLEGCKVAEELIALIEKWKVADQGSSYEIMDEIVGYAEKSIWYNAIKKAEVIK